MKAVIEIIFAMLAAFGIYSLLSIVKFHLLFPRNIRERVRAAVYLDCGSVDLDEVTEYVKYLRLEGKIYGGRLIILAKSDIINEIDKAVGGIGDEEFEILTCCCENNDESKETPDDE